VPGGRNLQVDTGQLGRDFVRLLVFAHMRVGEAQGGACDPREPIRQNKASVAVAVKNLNMMFPSSL